MELEGNRSPLMLKEWLELESSAELSREDGFACYPRHLLAELRSGNGSGRWRDGDVIAKVSAAVRAALFLPTGREGEAPALHRSFSRRLRVGFWWKRRKGEREVVDRRVASCSAATASGRQVHGSSPAMSPRRRSWEEGGQAGGVGGRQQHETEVLACHLNEEREQEQEQRLSPVSVMDFLSQDEDDGDGGSCDDDEVAPPTFQRSLANIRRASQQLLQKIKQFEQLAELDTSDMDDATTTTEDVNYHMMESDSTREGEEGDEGAPMRWLSDMLEMSMTGSTHCFRKLLVDFFRDGMSSCHKGIPDGLDQASTLMKAAKAWLEGDGCSLRSVGKAELSEEIERVGRWRCFREDQHELLAVDLEGDILWSLVGELVVELSSLEL